MDPLRIFVDTAEPRITKEGIITWNYGRIGDSIGPKDGTQGWPISENVYIEPTTGSIILLPGPLDSAFWSNGSGIYARTRLSSLTPTVSTGQFFEASHTFPEDYIIEGTNLNAGAYLTTGSLAANASIYLGFAVPNTGSVNAEAIHLVWSSDIAVKLYTDGRVEVWLNSELVSVGDLTGSTSPGKATDWVDVFIAPFGQQDILIWSSLGGTHIYHREDLTSYAQPVLPSGSLEIQIVQGGKCSLRLQAPALYHSSGYVVGYPFKLKYAPLTDGDDPQTLKTDAYAFEPPGASGGGYTTSVVKVDDPGSPWESGTDTGRIRVDISGNGTHSYWIYAAGARWSPITKSLGPEEESEIPREFLGRGSLSLEFGEHPRDCKAQFDIFDHENDLLPTNLATEQGCSADVRLGDQIIIRGSFYVREREFIFTNAEAEKLPCEITGLYDRLQIERMDNSLVFDGMTLSEAVALISEQSGVEIVCSSDPFLIEFGGCKAGSNLFGVTSDAGQSFAEALDRIREDFCATWFYGIQHRAGYPPRLALLAPGDLESEPATQVFLRAEEANMLFPEGQARAHVVQRWQETLMLPEANEIWVQGWDRNAGRPLLGFYRNAELQDPLTPRGSRPPGWRGCKEKYGLQDPAITTMDMVERAVQTLRDRLTVPRRIASCESGLWLDDDGLPITDGRLVEVVAPDWTRRFRVRKVTIKSMIEPTDSEAEWTAGLGPGSLFRKATYMLEEEEEVGMGAGLLDLKGAKTASDLEQLNSVHRIRIKDIISTVKRFKGPEDWTRLEPRAIYQAS